MKITEDEIKRFVKRIWPKVIENMPKTPCPDANVIAEFVEGKLRRKKLKDLYSHLVVCDKCIEIIKLSRIPMKEVDFETPEWFRAKIKELLPPEPKEWEISLKIVNDGFKIASYNGESCFTFPELERILEKEKPFSSKDLQKAIHSIEKISPEMAGDIKKFKEIKERLDLIEKEILGVKEINRREREKLLIGKKEELLNLLSNTKKTCPTGFYLQDHLGKYEVALFLTKNEGDPTNIAQVKLGICDLRGNPPEEMKLSLTQGRKIIEKSMVKKGITISNTIGPQKSRIKFEHYGIYMGQIAINFLKYGAVKKVEEMTFR